VKQKYRATVDNTAISAAATLSVFAHRFAGYTNREVKVETNCRLKQLRANNCKIISTSEHAHFPRLLPTQGYQHYSSNGIPSLFM
jgi:hypothetical protein